MLNGYMKAAVIRAYGDATVFKHEDIATPEPGADEVLVKVHYAPVIIIFCPFLSPASSTRTVHAVPAATGNPAISLSGMFFGA